MLLIILRKKLGGMEEVPEEGGSELGVLSTPGSNENNVLMWIPSPLILGLLGVIFIFLLTLLVAFFLFLFQSKLHNIPKFYHMWYVYICWMLGFEPCRP